MAILWIHISVTWMYSQSVLLSPELGSCCSPYSISPSVGVAVVVVVARAEVMKCVAISSQLPVGHSAFEV